MPRFHVKTYFSHFSDSYRKLSNYCISFDEEFKSEIHFWWKEGENFYDDNTRKVYLRTATILDINYVHFLQFQRDFITQAELEEAFYI